MPYDLNALMWEIQQAGAAAAGNRQDVARLTALVCDRLGCATAREAFDRLYGDWAALPRGTLLSGMRAGQILAVLPMLQLEHLSATPEQREELLREFREYGPPDTGWQANVMGISGQMSLLDGNAGPADLEAALSRLDEAMAMMPPDSPQRIPLEATHASVRAHLAQTGGGEDDFDSAVDDLVRLADAPVFDATQRLAMAGQIAVFRCRQAIRREDETWLAELIAELETVMERLPPDHVDRLGFESHLDAMRSYLVVLRERRTGRFDPEAARFTPVDDLRRQVAALPAHMRVDQLCEAGIARSGAATLARDAAAMRDAIILFEAALELLEPDDERWIRCTSCLALCHIALAGLGTVPHAQRPAHLDQGIAWARHARRLAGGPEYPLWANVSMALAMAYRTRGKAMAFDRRVSRRNLDESRRIGLEAVQAVAWTTLLQSGTAHAAETGRRAGEDALELARWCLSDGAYDEAVRALDGGRGLVLHAATVAATVPDMLTALGHTDLAREWRAAGAVAPEPGPEGVLAGQAGPSGPSSRLRRRVLEALSASPERRRLLDVPSVREIGAALHTLGATALVYLLPSGEGIPGFAVVVTPDGAVRHVRLPGLDGDAPELAGYRAVGAPGRDAGGPPTAPPGGVPRPRPSADAGRAALERLCDWAGRTVMEPLLKEIPRGFGTVPSVVLVPMAELGMVPWHAARLRGRRGRHRYACEEARISYLPSARLLCEVAGRRATPGPGEALVVGNPTRDLPHAGEEAEAVHRTFHPGGLLLGPGDATPAAVTGWLARQRGGLLHLACHGEVQQGERHSAYLALAGGRLAAEELTEGAARYEGLGLVVLAACRTNVSGRGYDEAYSLATAFLVAGARSVVGSLWPVPDEATSLLMYMTHHYLSREGLQPGQALRAAQLWMLNDRREAPPGMPAHLVARVPLIRSDDLAGWAGFTHLGW
ncbi:CHAT domain-containing protein [Streptomyces coeruleoprunus]